MDEADGNLDGKIGKDVWNKFNSIFGTKEIKNFKEKAEAEGIITGYFDNIMNENDLISYPVAQGIYNKLVMAVKSICLSNEAEEVNKTLDKIYNCLEK